MLLPSSKTHPRADHRGSTSSALWWVPTSSVEDETHLAEEEHGDVLGKEDDKNEGRDENETTLQSAPVAPAVLAVGRDENAAGD